MSYEEASTAPHDAEESYEDYEEIIEETEEDQDVVACSTANFIVKNFEKYLLLMNLIRPYAFEIFDGLKSTFEFLVKLSFKLLLILY